jgi:hypothetical protein
VSVPVVMMVLDIPDDPELLREFGTVAIRHAQLDRMLQMMIKTLTGVTVDEAIKATAREGSARLRVRIKKLGRKVLGDGSDFVRLQSLIWECERLTGKRNALLHGVMATELTGEHKMETKDLTWGPIPTVKELKELAADLMKVTGELNQARRFGFIHKALEKKGKSVP